MFTRRTSPIWPQLVVHRQAGGLQDRLTVQELLLQLQEEAETGRDPAAA